MDSKFYNSETKGITAFGTVDKDRNPLSVLIIGNGFDLDLGMHTSYKDFAESKLWPFDRPILNKGLGNYLNNIIHTERWLDLENELAKYAQFLKKPNLENEIQIQFDKEDFNELANRLKEYLQSELQNYQKNAHDCKAKDILTEFSRKKNYFIHSFNYTNVKSISDVLKIRLNSRKVEYVHGSLDNGDIILGAGDNTNLPEEYDFLYKTSNKHYTTNNLAESLDFAQEITIFGHSLGENDFEYFRPFFQKISQNRGVNYNKLTNERLSLTIYTKDEASENDLKRRLRKLTDNHLQGIYANCDFKIEYTKP